MSEVPSLLDKTALVTGASKGIGRGVALALARQGADVAINYNRDRAGAEETARGVEALGRRAIVVAGDVGSSADVERIFSETLDAFPRLYILINNAGVQTWKPLLELAEAEWDRVISTNLKGTFFAPSAPGET